MSTLASGDQGLCNKACRRKRHEAGSAALAKMAFWLKQGTRVCATRMQENLCARRSLR